MWDVAIVGAGMAGLVCGRSLQAAGYTVGLLEKSRGLGGRMATRRLHDTRVDHGARHLAFEHDQLSDLIQTMQAQKLLQPWPHRRYCLTATGEVQPLTDCDLAIAPHGMNTVGKFLGQGLKIHCQQRVVALQLTRQNTWQITCETVADTPAFVREAKAIVLAIPAPQALVLLQPLLKLGWITAEVIQALKTVHYEACITVMAGYESDRPLNVPATLTEKTDATLASILGWTVQSADHPVLRWIGLDSCKRPSPSQPVVVIQSSADFAHRNIDVSDLSQLETQLLSATADVITPELGKPVWSQGHRWRYAFVKQSLAAPYLFSSAPVPLLCCGDWCGGQSIGAALNSGMTAAAAINQVLHDKILPSPQMLWRG